MLEKKDHRKYLPTDDDFETRLVCKGTRNVLGAYFHDDGQKTSAK